MQAAVGLGDVAQHAVAAQAHHRLALVGLDVDVRGPSRHRLGEQGVDQADDRRVVRCRAGPRPRAARSSGDGSTS